MKKRVFVLVFLFGILSFASASDVAYIYHSDSKIDSNLISVFTELGLTTDLINEKELPLDFSEYEFIFVGDERFRKEIPVGDYPTVVVNYHYGTEWGLTDRDGASQLGSTAPLNVVQENQDVMVYTQAFKRGRIAVPYYYLSNKNKADSLRQVVATKTTSSGYKFGDVISYADAGAVLANGKVAQGNICFFGIVESGFWTPEAREMFKDCVEFASSWVVPSPVEPGIVECFTNEDCGIDGFVGGPFCTNDSIYQDYEMFTCYEPGSEESYCDSYIYEEFVEDCDYMCEEGACVGELPGEKVHDVGFVEFSNSVNMIRLEHANGTDILEGEDLMCNEKYKIGVKLENKGNFTENISFSGSVGGALFNHNSINEHEPGVRKLKTKTVNFTVGEGTYDIIVEAFIDGFADVNPLDNLVSREVFVSCEDSECLPGEICDWAG